jgi:hypothetical protein
MVAALYADLRDTWQKYRWLQVGSITLAAVFRGMKAICIRAVDDAILLAIIGVLLWTLLYICFGNVDIQALTGVLLGIFALGLLIG